MYSYATPRELYWWQDLIQPYVKNRQLFICPSSIKYRYTYYRPPGEPKPLIYTYACNAMWPGPPGSGTGGYGGGGVMLGSAYGDPVGAPLARVIAPSECIMLVEANWMMITMANRTDCWDADNGRLRKDHNEMANWVFVDGHVKTMRVSEPHMWSITNVP